MMKGWYRLGKREESGKRFDIVLEYGKEIMDVGEQGKEEIEIGRKKLTHFSFLMFLSARHSLRLQY